MYLIYLVPSTEETPLHSQRRNAFSDLSVLVAWGHLSWSFGRSQLECRRWTARPSYILSRWHDRDNLHTIYGAAEG